MKERLKRKKQSQESRLHKDVETAPQLMRIYPGIITCQGEGKIYRQEEQKISKIITSKHNIFKEQKVLSMDPEKPSSKHISFLTGGDPGIPDRGVAVPEPVRKQVYKENQHMKNVLPDSRNEGNLL